MGELKSDRLLREIKQLQEELKRHQDKCKHAKKYLIIKYGGSSGHYDPVDDYYWTDYKCALCKKGWRETQ